MCIPSLPGLFKGIVKMHIDLRVKIQAALMKHSKGALNLNTENFLDEAVELVKAERRLLKVHPGRPDARWLEYSDSNERGFRDEEK